MGYEKGRSQKTDQLETRYRDFLQIALVKKIFKDGSTREQINQWVVENAGKIGDIIDGDSEEAVKIRKLAREERYNEAVKLLKELL